MSASPDTAAVISLEAQACGEVAIAGGKGASLAAMTAAGLPVPPGFVIASGVLERSVDPERLRAHARAREHGPAQELVGAADPPREEIDAAYARLGGAVAVRSSACAEDSEAASYAGQQETYLGVERPEEICDRVVDCWASFFSERALFYRERKGSLDDLAMAVVVQRMLKPAKSGVLFTVHPVNRRRDRMLIEAIAGLGEKLVSGEATPDHYVVDRAGKLKREQLVAERLLDEDELRELAEVGVRLEQHFGSPQDVEWAIADGRVNLLQSRPVTTL